MGRISFSPPEIDLLQAVLETVPLSLFITDSAGIVRRVEGRGAPALSGENRPFLDFPLGPILGGGPEIAGALEQALRGEPGDVEFELGSSLLHGRFSPFRGSDGEVAGALAVVRDITAESRRGGDPQEAMRLQAMECLCRGVSHDFNNSLTAVQGYSELLKVKLQADDPNRRYLDEICRAARRAGEINRQLHVFNRKKRSEPLPCDLNHVLQGSGKMVHRLLGEDVELVTRQDEHLWSTWADSAQMEQVVLNVAVHARSMLGRGGGQVTIETGNLRHDGAGLPVPEGDYVTVTFRTAAENAVPQDLSDIRTVREIVGEAGGHLHSAIDRNGEAAFRIFLPRYSRVPKPEAVPAAPPFEQVAQSTGTVLLVEDEVVVRDLVGRILLAQGHQVLSAANGDEALALVGGHDGAIHLLLTDVVLPGMSGVEVAERLTADLPGLKILFMSGYTDDTLERYGVTRFRAPFLSKPFSSEDLARTVQDLFSRVA